MTHGGTVEELREKVADVNARRERLQGAAFDSIGMSAYVIIRDTEAEARAELERITTINPDSPGYASFEEFTKHSNLDVEVSAREYSVGTRALRPELVGTPEQLAEKIRAFEEAGVNLLLIQARPHRFTRSSSGSPPTSSRWSARADLCVGTNGSEGPLTHRTSGAMSSLHSSRLGSSTTCVVKT